MEKVRNEDLFPCYVMLGTGVEEKKVRVAILKDKVFLGELKIFAKTLINFPFVPRRCILT